MKEQLGQIIANRPSAQELTYNPECEDRRLDERETIKQQTDQCIELADQAKHRQDALLAQNKKLQETL